MNREPLYGTYETEDAETDGTVAHRTEIRKPKANQNCSHTVTVTRNTLSRSEPHYIPISKLPGVREARSGRCRWRDFGRGTSRRRPRSPAYVAPSSSPPSELSVSQGLPPAGFRGEGERGKGEGNHSYARRFARSCDRAIEKGSRGAQKTVMYHCAYTLKLAAR